MFAVKITFELLPNNGFVFIKIHSMKFSEKTEFHCKSTFVPKYRALPHLQDARRMAQTRSHTYCWHHSKSVLHTGQEILKRELVTLHHIYLIGAGWQTLVRARIEGYPVLLPPVWRHKRTRVSKLQTARESVGKGARESTRAREMS